MHIYSLSFNNPRIICDCQLSCFYDFKITLDKYYQYEYIIFSIQFLKLSILVNFIHGHEWIHLIIFLRYLGLLKVSLLM